MATVLFSFLGIFLPVLNTTRSIISRDSESQREYLTYWTVYTLTESVVGLCARLHPVWAQRYPPELKLFWVIWLTSPQYQGAYRIYVFLIKPIFEKTEKHIDDTLDDIWARFWAKTYTVGKSVIWQIAFAPQDDVVLSTLKEGMSTARKAHAAGAAFLNELEKE